MNGGFFYCLTDDGGWKFLQGRFDFIGYSAGDGTTVLLIALDAVG